MLPIDACAKKLQYYDFSSGVANLLSEAYDSWKRVAVHQSAHNRQFPKHACFILKTCTAIYLSIYWLHPSE
jgi:hypothetical protein